MSARAATPPTAPPVMAELWFPGLSGVGVGVLEADVMFPACAVGGAVEAGGTDRRDLVRHLGREFPHVVLADVETCEQ
jgi:hypothetical protein